MTSDRRISIVIEFENATMVSWDRVGILCRTLASQIAGLGLRATPEVICVHANDDRESALLREQILTESSDLGMVADLRCIALPGGRYYELKNAGIAAAHGDVIVLTDSDVLPEPGWLQELVCPFEDETTVAATGHTFLGHDNLFSRTFALTWVFPLRDNDQRAIDRRSFVANNCALRSDWIKAHPFAGNTGFKVDCTLMARHLQANQIGIVRVPARACHAPLSGFRFFIWRALVTGRDADRKIRALGCSNNVTRVARALKQGVKTQLRTVRRVLTRYRHVALPLWQVPIAVAIGTTFYGLALIAQILHGLGISSSPVERVPAYAEVH